MMMMMMMMIPKLMLTVTICHLFSRCLLVSSGHRFCHDSLGIHKIQLLSGYNPLAIINQLPFTEDYGTPRHSRNS